MTILLAGLLQFREYVVSCNFMRIYARLYLRRDSRFECSRRRMEMAYSLSYIKPLTKKGFIKNASTFLSFFLFKIAFPFFSPLPPIFVVNDFQRCRLKPIPRDTAIFFPPPCSKGRDKKKRMIRRFSVFPVSRETREGNIQRRVTARGRREVVSPEVSGENRKRRREMVVTGPC